MAKPTRSVRVLGTLALLIALVMLATPAAADPGAASALDTVFTNMGPPNGIGIKCAWWIPWC